MALKKQQVVFHDRYSATGKPRPNPLTVCRGPCEGMGYYPDMERARQLGLPASEVLFVKCETCGGTGFRRTDG